MTDKNKENVMDDEFVVEVPSDVESANAVLADTMETLLETADVNRVYGSPIKRGDYTIIPTAEVLAVAGFGVGYGSGEGPMGENDQPEGQGMGGGGGGGGKAFSRPVAIVISGPEGVRVEPVLDITKFGLAAITAFGFMFTTMVRVKRGRIQD